MIPARRYATRAGCRTIQEYMGRRIDYGGESRTIGSVIQEMQSEGIAQRLIDAYIMGATFKKPLDLQDTRIYNT